MHQTMIASVRTAYNVLIDSLNKLYLTYKLVLSTLTHRVVGWVEDLVGRVKHKLKKTKNAAVSWLHTTFQNLIHGAARYHRTLLIVAAISVVPLARGACTLSNNERLSNFATSIKSAFLYVPLIGKKIGPLVASVITATDVDSIFRPLCYAFGMTPQQRTEKRRRELSEDVVLAGLRARIETQKHNQHPSPRRGASSSTAPSTTFKPTHADEETTAAANGGTALQSDTFGEMLVKKRYEAPGHQILLVSGSNKSRPWTTIVNENHIEAAKGIADYMYYESNLGEETPPRSWQWMKIDILHSIALNMITTRTAQRYRYILWVDDDILLRPLAGWIYDYTSKMNAATPAAWMLIAKDAGTGGSVNTGMMLFNFSSDHEDKDVNLPIYLVVNGLTEIWDAGDKYGTSYCPNQSCLHEQEAVERLIQEGADLFTPQRLIVVDPRDGTQNINTFCRRSHYDTKRNMNLNYSNDVDEYRYRVTDNSVHVTGMEEWLRMHTIRELNDLMKRDSSSITRDSIRGLCGNDDY